MDPARSRHTLRGVLLGLAVGDALGLPWEGMTRQRVARMAPPRGEHHLAWGRGLCSDDTEHACMTAEALLRSAAEEQKFARSLAWRLRFWLLLLPAGVGMATARSCLKLWLGFSPRHSGVFSAGNGPAMRAPLLGAVLGGDPQHLERLVTLSTRMTHTDPIATQGALLVAWATWLSAQQRPVTPAEFQTLARERLTGPSRELWLELVQQVVTSLAQGEDIATFADKLGLHRGVSGYMGHTVPIALHAWLRHPGDYEQAVWPVVRLGGDTDTVAAIVGGMVGAGVGEEGIPPRWLDRLWEWPRNRRWLTELADRLAHRPPHPTAPPALFYPAILLRNVLFLSIVLGHGFRRLLPPY